MTEEIELYKKLEARNNRLTATEQRLNDSDKLVLRLMAPFIGAAVIVNQIRLAIVEEDIHPDFNKQAADQNN